MDKRTRRVGRWPHNTTSRKTPNTFIQNPKVPVSGRSVIFHWVLSLGASRGLVDSDETAVLWRVFSCFLPGRPFWPLKETTHTNIPHLLNTVCPGVLRKRIQLGEMG